MYKKQKLTAYSRSLTPSPTHSFPTPCPGGTWGKLPCALTFLSVDWAIPILSHYHCWKESWIPNHRLRSLPLLSTLMCPLVHFHWNYSNRMLSSFCSYLLPCPTPSTHSQVLHWISALQWFSSWTMEDDIIWVRFWLLSQDVWDAQDADSYLTLFHLLLCI